MGSGETAPGASWKTINKLLNLWKKKTFFFLFVKFPNLKLAVAPQNFPNCSMIDVYWHMSSMISCIQKSKVIFLFTKCANNIAIRPYLTVLVYILYNLDKALVFKKYILNGNIFPQIQLITPSNTFCNVLIVSQMHLCVILPSHNA